MTRKAKTKIKWGNRLEERARESLSSPLVWWVHQKEAEAKIRKIEKRMRAAERLLLEALNGNLFAEFPRTEGEIIRHLEAAKKENGQ